MSRKKQEGAVLISYAFLLMRSSYHFEIKHDKVLPLAINSTILK